MKKILRKIALVVVSSICALSLSIEAFAASNVTYPSYVTPEMVKADFWKDLTDNPDEVLLSTKQINKLNSLFESSSDLTNIVDLEKVDYVGYGSFEKFSSDVYINNKKVSQEEYIAEFKKDIKKISMQLQLKELSLKFGQ